MAGPPHGGIQGTTNYGPSNSFFGTVADLSIGRVVLYDLGYPRLLQTDRARPQRAARLRHGHRRAARSLAHRRREVPGGKEFVGWQAFSDDLNHFVFSSNVAFVAGVESFPNAINCCTYPQYEFEAGQVLSRRRSTTTTR